MVSRPLKEAMTVLAVAVATVGVLQLANVSLFPTVILTLITAAVALKLTAVVFYENSPRYDRIFGDNEDSE